MAFEQFVYNDRVFWAKYSPEPPADDSPAWKEIAGAFQTAPDFNPKPPAENMTSIDAKTARSVEGLNTEAPDFEFNVFYSNFKPYYREMLLEQAENDYIWIKIIYNGISEQVRFLGTVQKKPPTRSGEWASQDVRAISFYPAGDVEFIDTTDDLLTTERLTAPIVSNNELADKITWLSVSNAVSYLVNRGNTVVANIAADGMLEYIYGATPGNYTVVAVGDVKNYANSPRSNVIVVA